MDTRCWHRFAALVALAFLFILPSQSAPAFKLKHFNFYNKQKQMSSANRLERRLIGGSSPIHFISPFVAPPVNPFEQFFMHPVPVRSAPPPPPSNIYRLNLQMLANGKPHSVMRGLPKKRQQMLDYAASNIIKLPLKYMSNAKPVGVYFKDRFMNYL